jgi:hypothetical protein
MPSNTQSLFGPLLTSSLVTAQEPPAPATTVIVKVISGDNRIDPLLDDIAYRFNNGSPVGTAVTVTFSFPVSVPSTYTGEDVLGWKPFSDQQKAATREVLGQLQQQTKIMFQEVAESAYSSGTMRFSNNIQATSAGYAFLPNSTQSENDADTWIAIGTDTGVERGSYSWQTLVHEIGHAVGLNHPGNYNAGAAPKADAVGNFLSADEDAFFNSIMSYRQSAQEINSVWFMPYDVLTLRYLYGTNPVATGDSTYSYSDADGRLVQNLVDDGGIDTLDFSAVTAGIQLDLTPGAYSSVGKLASGANALANLTISFDAVIEHAAGSPADDTMMGNAANNRLGGGAGNDTIGGGAGNDNIDGAGGTDTSVYSGNISDYYISYNRALGTATIKDNRTNADGTDTLKSIERLQFSDKTFDLINPSITGTPGYGKIESFLFDAAYYLLKKPELVPTVTLATAYNHYKAVGAATGDAPNAWFDPVYYANKWADLKPLNLNAATLFQHYNLFGVWEGRSGGPTYDRFDGTRYLSNNPDVAAYVDAYVADFLGSRSNGAIAHYVIYGGNEGRVAFETTGSPIEQVILVGTLE